MFNRSNKGLISLVLAVLMAATLCGQALSETMTVYSAMDDALVYNIDGTVIGTVGVNTAMTLTGLKNGICRVVRDGFEAYMLKAQLSLTTTDGSAQPEATPQPTLQPEAKTMNAYVVIDSATVYNIKGEALGSLTLNTEVAVTGLKGTVCQIRYNDNIGYMFLESLGLAPVAAATPGPAATPEPVATAQPQSISAWVAADGAVMYDAQGGNQGILAQNTQVTVTAVVGNICKVSYNGGDAFMCKADLTVTPVAAVEAAATPEPVQPIQNVKGYAAVDGAMVVDDGGKLIAMLALNTEVEVLGMKKDVCMVTVGSGVGYMRIEDLSREKTQADATSGSSVAATISSTITPAKGTAQEMDWWTSDIQKIFAKGTVVQVTDVATGLSWREVRYGGDNHADCQPLTSMDTAVLKQVFGGEWSWDRRAVFVTINGVNYAAAINGMPHDDSSIDDNGFEGHHCIHFTNSRTHGTNEVDAQSQEAIRKAASTAL